MENNIIGCIDSSSSAISVCQYSAWFAHRLKAPLTLLHVLEKNDELLASDLSGSIGFDSRDQLLDELVQLEGARARIMKEQGKQLLHVAENNVKGLGVDDVKTIQKQGELPEILSEIQAARLVILGRRGEQSEASGQVGSQLESVIRLQKCPILVCKGEYIPPTKVMFAYDGSERGKKVLERFATSPILNNVELHLVMNGDDQAALEIAQAIFRKEGIKSVAQLISGDNIVDSLCHYAQENDINLTIMSAYGHSRLRQFFIGSNTTMMLAKTPTSLLILR